MLKLWFGHKREARVGGVDTSFKLAFENEWMDDPLSRKIVESIEKSKIISNRIVDNPVMGEISIFDISSGCKQVLLMQHLETEYVYLSSTMGDNCAKWVQEVAKLRDVTLSINSMFVFEDDVQALCMNTGAMINGYRDYLDTYTVLMHFPVRSKFEIAEGIQSSDEAWGVLD